MHRKADKYIQLWASIYYTKTLNNILSCGNQRVTGWWSYYIQVYVHAARNNTKKASDNASTPFRCRWDDDVVFKNCAKMEDDKKKAEFINDTLRSEFHRKFMNKYIK